MSPRPSRNVRFMRADVNDLKGESQEVQVELKGAANVYLGRAQGGRFESDTLQTAAEAAADALRQLGHAVKVETVELLHAAGQPAVVARVVARYDDEVRTLVGLCVTGEQPLRASVLAVLNATNRFLETG